MVEEGRHDGGRGMAGRVFRLTTLLANGCSRVLPDAAMVAALSVCQDRTVSWREGWPDRDDEIAALRSQ